VASIMFFVKSETKKWLSLGEYLRFKWSSVKDSRLGKYFYSNLSMLQIQAKKMYSISVVISLIQCIIFDLNTFIYAKIESKDVNRLTISREFWVSESFELFLG
jgi:hypothetical protein